MDQERATCEDTTTEAHDHSATNVTFTLDDLQDSTPLTATGSFETTFMAHTSGTGNCTSATVREQSDSYTIGASNLQFVVTPLGDTSGDSYPVNVQVTLTPPAGTYNIVCTIDVQCLNPPYSYHDTCDDSVHTRDAADVEQFSLNGTYFRDPNGHDRIETSSSGSMTAGVNCAQALSVYDESLILNRTTNPSQNCSGGTITPSARTLRLQIVGQGSVGLDKTGDGVEDATYSSPDQTIAFQTETQLQLQAHPATGWQFDHWVRGTTNSTSNPYSLALSGADQVTAVFVQSTANTTPGGCCLPDHTCQDLTADVCEQLGGSAWGSGTTCADYAADVCQSPVR
jgi:hypothetical protein